MTRLQTLLADGFSGAAVLPALRLLCCMLSTQSTDGRLRAARMAEPFFAMPDLVQSLL